MKKVVVTIHGVGRTPADFWRPQVQAIADHLGDPPAHRAVWWGDLVDAGSSVPRAVGQLRHFASRVRGASAADCPPAAPGPAARVSDQLHRAVTGTAGVAAYLLPTSTRAAIRDRLRQTLGDLAGDSRDIVLVSESLGCLIAFDVLRADAHRYNLSAWVTLGCPLRTLVRTGQCRADLGAISPHTVRSWLNLYAPRDLVAAPVASVFPAYPVRDEAVAGSHNRIDAHHYWRNPRAVSLIAGTLRG